MSPELFLVIALSLLILAIQAALFVMASLRHERRLEDQTASIQALTRTQQRHHLDQIKVEREKLKGTVNVPPQAALATLEQVLSNTLSRSIHVRGVIRIMSVPLPALVLDAGEEEIVVTTNSSAYISQILRPARRLSQRTRVETVDILPDLGQLVVDEEIYQAFVHLATERRLETNSLPKPDVWQVILLPATTLEPEVNKGKNLMPKKSFAAILVAVLIVASLLSAGQTLAASAFKAKVVTAASVNLKLRALPSGKASAVDLLPDGTIVDVYGIAVTDVTVNVPVGAQAIADGPTVDQIWLYVQHGETTGWINARYALVTDLRGHGLTPEALLKLPQVDPTKKSNGGVLPATTTVSTSPSTTTPTTTSTTTTVNKNVVYVANLNASAHLSLREQPDGASKRLALLPVGIPLTILGRSLDATGEKWLYVSVSVDGAVQQGYVNGRYISSAAPAVAAADNTTPVTPTTSTTPVVASNTPVTTTSTTPVTTANTTTSGKDEPPVVNVVP